jgi:predicted lactoylglutathione lyase
MLLCLSRDSREAVDAITAKAGVRRAALIDPNPPQDYGFMYGRSYADPDGHIWETDVDGPGRRRRRTRGLRRQRLHP